MGSARRSIPARRPEVRRAPLPSFAGRRLRASADYRLVAHDALSEGQQAMFADLVEDGELYGLLVPTRAVQKGVKAVDHGLARLFEALSQPAAISSSSSSSSSFSPSSAPPDDELARLVLDGILEVELEGTFHSGPGASAWQGVTSPTAGHGVLAQLSHDALVLAFDVPIEDPRPLSTWIYLYNGAPLTPVWCRRFGDEATLRAALGLDEPSARARPLEAEYLRSDHPAWWSWSRRDRDPELPLPYKLYVSPRPDAGVGAIAAALEELAERDVPSFKLGRGVHGLLRPDKLVAYLPHWDALRELGEHLLGALGGASAQGVPFSAALTDDGLLSWGMDPPEAARLPGWRGMESWRLWLTNQLARTLLHARQAGVGAEQALAFSLARLRLEGVDTRLWVPAEDLWPSEVRPS